MKSTLAAAGFAVFMAAGAGTARAQAAEAGDAGTGVATPEIGWALELSTDRHRDGSFERRLELPLTLRLAAGPWSARLELPFVAVDRRGGARPSHARGIGDVALKLGYALREAGDDGVAVVAALKLKTRTGDADSGLGSGTTDWTVTLDAAAPAGRFDTWARLGWRRIGAAPGVAPVRHAALGEVGALTPLALGCDAGGVLAGRESTGARDGQLDLSALAECPAGRGRWQIQITRGLQAASPDHRISVAYLRSL